MLEGQLARLGDDETGRRGARAFASRLRSLPAVLGSRFKVHPPPTPPRSPTPLFNVHRSRFIGLPHRSKRRKRRFPTLNPFFTTENWSNTELNPRRAKGLGRRVSVSSSSSFSYSSSKGARTFASRLRSLCAGSSFVVQRSSASASVSYSASKGARRLLSAVLRSWFNVHRPPSSILGLPKSVNPFSPQRPRSDAELNPRRAKS